MQVQPLPSATTHPSEPITRSEGHIRRTMTKSQKQLDSFKLTDEEKQAIKRYEREQTILELIGFIILVAICLVAVWATTELLKL